MYKNKQMIIKNIYNYIVKLIVYFIFYYTICKCQKKFNFKFVTIFKNIMIVE